MKCPKCQSLFAPGLTGGTCPYCGNDTGFIYESGGDDPPDYPVRKVIRRGTHVGRPYRVVKHAIGPWGWSHYTGYVETPLPNYYGQGELNEKIRVHGAITFVGNGQIGFDVNHAFDVCVGGGGDPLPGDFTGRSLEERGYISDQTKSLITKWSPDDVEDEAKRLAEEVAREERKIDVYADTDDRILIASCPECGVYGRADDMLEGDDCPECGAVVVNEVD